MQFILQRAISFALILIQYRHALFNAPFSSTTTMLWNLMYNSQQPQQQLFSRLCYKINKFASVNNLRHHKINKLRQLKQHD